MGTVSTSYSHAAPFIRQHLVNAVYEATNARTERDRRANWARADAFALALEIMAESDDQTPVAGIADVETLSAAALQEARKRFASQDEEILGPVEPEEAQAIEKYVEHLRQADERLRRIAERMAES